MKKLEGYLDNGHGLPLADIPATATILGTSTVVDTTMTDAAGRWTFAGLPTADEYLVTLTDTLGNAVSRAPWSGEMRELWVRDRLDVLGKPVVLDPAAGNSLLWSATGLFVPPPPVIIDAYVNVTGDTMSGGLVIVQGTSPYALNVTGDTTIDLGNLSVNGYIGATGDIYSHGKTVGVSATVGNVMAWNSDGFYVAAGAVSDIWVNTTGDTMTGNLTISTGTLLLTAANPIVEMGQVGVANTPGIDFHSSANSNDYDVRLWATGGAAAIGQGTLQVEAATLAVSGAITSGGSALISQSAADTRYVNVAGDTMTNTLTISSGDLTITAGRLNILQANAGLEFGAQGTANTPFFDFHSGAVNTDWDVRLIANGGTGVNSGGTLQILAATLAVSNNQTIGGTLGVTGVTTLAAGSAGTPSLTLAGWPSTGLYQSGANELAITIAGTQRLMVNSLGAWATALNVNSRPVIMAGCHAYHNVNQAITTGVETTLAFNAERFDSDNFHDLVTNNSRLTVPAGLGGKYLIWAIIEWQIKADTTNRVVRITRNGANTIAFATSANMSSAGYNHAMPLSVVFDMAAGDYVQCLVRHDSGANLNVNFDADYSPAFGMQRLG